MAVGRVSFGYLAKLRLIRVTESVCDYLRLGSIPLIRKSLYTVDLDLIQSCCCIAAMVRPLIYELDTDKFFFFQTYISFYIILYSIPHLTLP